MSANLLSMGAVDFGIIVDGAVILVEHCSSTGWPGPFAESRTRADRQAHPDRFGHRGRSRGPRCSRC
jgi:hypothetical protein